MVGFSSVKRITLRKGYIKDRTRIKQPKLNLVTVGRDSSFPSNVLSLKQNTPRLTSLSILLEMHEKNFEYNNVIEHLLN